MDHRLKLQRYSQEPHFYYYDLEECAIRSEIIDGEICYFIKYRGAREIKAIFDSRIVGNALANHPEVISREEYFNF
jgi:hypothetical protein